MSKINFLTYVVIILVIINVFSIGKMFLDSSHNGHKPPPKTIIIDKLKFDESQIHQYELLIFEHRNKIDSLDNLINTTKKELYLNLNQPENKAVSDSLLNAISKYEKEVEQIHYNHFLDIKKICKPHQMYDFEQLTTELDKLFSKPPKR